MTDVNQFTRDVDSVQKVGQQDSREWPAGSAGQGGILFTGTVPPGAAMRVYTSGENVHLTIKTGTSETSKTERVVPPARFVAGGTVTVFATVVDDALTASARVRVELVPSGDAPDVVGIETGPHTFQTNARGFTAYDACALTVRGVAVALAAGQSIPIRGPATLNSGSGAVHYEP